MQPDMYRDQRGGGDDNLSPGRGLHKSDGLAEMMAEEESFFRRGKHVGQKHFDPPVDGKMGTQTRRGDHGSGAPTGREEPFDRNVQSTVKCAKGRHGVPFADAIQPGMKGKDPFAEMDYGRGTSICDFVFTKTY